MGTLRDQLLKKGLADEKRERQVRHQEDARKKKIGKEAVEAEARAREEQLRAEAEQQRVEDRRRETEKVVAHQEQLHSERIPALIRAGQVKSAGFGNKRFYFVTREQTVSFVEVASVTSRGLADGRHAIIETRGDLRDDFCVVDAETARSIQALEPDRVVFWQDGAGGR
jgi:uncharacterized protein YaiL (DUF2058 family)